MSQAIPTPAKYSIERNKDTQLWDIYKIEGAKKTRIAWDITSLPQAEARRKTLETQQAKNDNFTRRV